MIELKEYLGIVVQIEKDVDTQKRLYLQLSKISNDCDSLLKCLEKRISVQAIPQKPENSKSCVPSLVTSGAFCSILITIFCITVIALYWNEKTFALHFWIIAELLIWVQILRAISSNEKKSKKHYKVMLAKYEKECEKVQYERLQIQNQVNSAKIQKQVVESYLQQVKVLLTSSQKNLAKTYDCNIIFPKYRNYIMVSSLYEYLSAGRCTTLEGHEGAYNILELEIRLDRIITKLDAVLKNLEAIKLNQYTLYSCLNESNQTINMLLQEERQIANTLQKMDFKTSSINARLALLQNSSNFNNYLVNCNRHELEYMNRIANNHP